MNKIMNKMKNRKLFLCCVAMLACMFVNTSCDDTKSYAELLEEENDAVEKYLSSFTVIDEVPADNNFQVGESAPYYKLDEDGYVYMQVLDKGDAGMAAYNEVIYFRYSRLNLLTWSDGGDQTPTGNDSSLASPYSFNFQNTVLSFTTQFGTGIQQPLYYLEKNCRVNLIVKSKVGPSSEISSVTPYLYEIRYFPSNI